MAATTRIAIRPLGSDDVDNVADIHVAAFPKSVLSRTGREVVRRYYAWHLAKSKDPILLGAFDDDRLAAFILAGPAFQPIDRFVIKEFAYLSWRVLTRPQAFIDRTAAARASGGAKLIVRRVASALGFRSRAETQTEPPPAFTVLAIGVHPEAEGGGIGRLLMGHAEDVARRHGFRVMSLSVHSDNERAVRFYRDLGYEAQPEGATALRMSRTIPDRPPTTS